MIRLIRELIRPYRGTLLIILLAMMVETAMSLAAPWPLKVIIDNVVGSHKLPHWLDQMVRPMLEGGGKLQVAGLAALAVIVIALLGALATYIDNYYTESVGQWVANDLRLRTYHHLQRLSLGYYDTHQTGTLLSTITTDIQTIQGFASSSTLNILVDLLTIVSMLGLMFWLNWDFTMIAVGVTPFLLFFVSRFKKAVKKATHEVRKEQSQIVAVVQQGLESMQVVKAFGRQDLEEAESRRGQSCDGECRSCRPPGEVDALARGDRYCRPLHCGRLVARRRPHPGGSDDGRCSHRLPVVPEQVLQAGERSGHHHQRDRAGRGRGRSHPRHPRYRRHHSRAPDAIEPAAIKGEIVFEHVAFAYSADAPVLKDVSFTIKPGQMVGVVGPTGSGKSTVVSLIPRFYDPTSGIVKIDGRDVRDYKIQPLRDQIGYVLQDTVLFRGTIRDNIAFGRPKATKEEIVAAAKLANADEFISRMPQGYDTMVGDRGLTLSGGQRQRIGIARVMVRNSPILLLDEPTAALDSESERSVIEALERLMKGRTVITIAHRLSTIRDADQIIVMAGGVVAESGNHDELMAPQRNLRRPSSHAV